MFECAESRICECQNAHIDHIERTHFGSQNLKTIFAKDTATSKDWETMITLYTQKDFTFHKDTLPALSGIANRMRNAGQYFAGMWGNGMPQSLLWYTTVENEKQPSRPTEYLAPSFAWPSVIGPTNFLDCSEMQAKFTIKGIGCTPKGDSPLGEVSNGCMFLVAARLSAVFVNRFDGTLRADTFLHDSARGTFCQYATLKCEDLGHFIFHPDVLSDSELVAGTPLWCLQLFVHKSQEQHYSYGLVLCQDKKPSLVNGMRRLGIFASIPSHRFTDQNVSCWMMV
jgi:hypothetical protein